jgi:hypothetical protein
MVARRGGTPGIAEPPYGCCAAAPGCHPHAQLNRKKQVMACVHIGGEKKLLLAFLDQQREVVLWKLEGLTDDQLRLRPLDPSELCLLGLVKHLASAEWYWFCDLFGHPAEPVSLATSDEAQLEEGDTTDSVLAYYSRARAASDRSITELDLDTTATTWLGDTVSFRWAILHVIEESARHAGHADLIRQHIDNTTGYLPQHRPH